MRRDKELFREILLAVEAREPGADSAPVELEGRPLDLISGHVELMVEAGLLAAQPVPGTLNETFWFVERLTYQGHEMLDTIRDPEVWRRTKAAATKVGGVSLHLLIELAKAVGKQVLTDRLGIAVG